MLSYRVWGVCYHIEYGVSVMTVRICHIHLPKQFTCQGPGTMVLWGVCYNIKHGVFAMTV